ncbi:ATP-binding protein [Chelatococcus sp. SYSU_G07232]|uniref:ATP-binding protein n=1 Tax=Chelatococcus albus TaxID=3047466 RepID=A0ABT7AB85_9HYPH|nr:ATP-binding protein [Chelatococcus sp. SYSU_G07232]MDJ1156636.1 ATP-binding protein [Chelatococcus sp. SYSU_G07232]
MNAVEHVSISIQEDFLARQTRAQPIAALAELIWNSLDGEASSVDVEFERADLAGGLSKIVVYDNGEGFPRSEAAKLFGNLGGSWKRLTRRTRTKSRMVHGQEGRGRYKAFALGRSIVWKVCYLEAGKPKAFEISLLESDLKDVAITEERDAPGQASGVIVEIADIERDFRVLESDEGLQELAETFALYLINYQDVAIRIAGQRLDPETVIAGQEQLTLPPIKDADGTEYPAELHLIEWRADTKRTLYLCSENGFPLDQVETRFHVPGFSFSAYLKSPYIAALHNDGRLGVAKMVPELRQAVDVAREAIKEHFRERAAQRARNVVEEWKSADIYPFKGEPATPVEKAERQVFDIVAVNVQEFTPELAAATPKARALHLRMLRHAIERGPDDLQMILREVLDLPERKQKELAALLQETTLSAIITAAKTVADRLKFIAALESIVFDPETKGRLKERSQLHKILAENTWVLGEEYNLWASDKDLKRVLEKHRAVLDPDIVIDDPVKVIGKKRGIVDLMLSRATRRHRANDIEHLVVELKAPKVVIGADEITQAKRYAMAVSKDERFHTVKGVRWHFWIVSNSYDEFARADIEGGPDPARQLIHRKDNISVGIKTWGELIEENRARLQFFQEHLEHSADESAAIRYLQERHSKYLEGVIEIDDEAVNQDADKGEREQKSASG